MTHNLHRTLAITVGLFLSTSVAFAAPTNGQQPFAIGEHSWDSKQAFIESGARCATLPPTAAEAARIEREIGPSLRALQTARGLTTGKGKPPWAGGGGGASGGGTVTGGTINVYFLVITAADGSGNVTDSMIASQE